jgi:hypothetical protein
MPRKGEPGKCKGNIFVTDSCHMSKLLSHSSGNIWYEKPLPGNSIFTLHSLFDVANTFFGTLGVLVDNPDPPISDYTSMGLNVDIFQTNI